MGQIKGYIGFPVELSRLPKWISCLDKLKRVAQSSQAKRTFKKSSTAAGKGKSQDKQLILGGPRPPVIRRPFRLNPAAFLVPAIPTIIGKTSLFLLGYHQHHHQLFQKNLLSIYLGLGAGLAWIASQQSTFSTSISSIGSPKTNVTVAMTNTNNPSITQTLSNTNTASNTNNDQDQLTQTATNTNTNN